MHYDEIIRVVRKGEYADFKETALANFLECTIGTREAHSDRAAVSSYGVKYLVAIAKKNYKYYVVLVFSKESCEDVGHGDSGYTLRYTDYQSFDHEIDKSIIDDDKRIFDSIMDKNWSDMSSDDVVFGNYSVSVYID